MRAAQSTGFQGCSPHPPSSTPLSKLKRGLVKRRYKVCGFSHIVLAAIVVSLRPEKLVDLVRHRVVRVVGEVRPGLVAAKTDEEQWSSNLVINEPKIVDVVNNGRKASVAVERDRFWHCFALLVMQRVWPRRSHFVKKCPHDRLFGGGARFDTQNSSGMMWETTDGLDMPSPLLVEYKAAVSHKARHGWFDRACAARLARPILAMNFLCRQAVM